MNINNIIVNEAKSKLNFKEIKGNHGFVNKEFEEEMIAIGFEDGNAWCSLFGEYVWKKAYQQYNATYREELDNLFSKVAVTTYYNFRRAKWIVDKKPIEGALVVWQKHHGGKKDWTGHLGIVIKVNKDLSFETSEGNSNSSGGREGIEVAKQARKLDYSEHKNGLNLLGFIYPKN